MPLWTPGNSSRDAGCVALILYRRTWRGTSIYNYLTGSNLTVANCKFIANIPPVSGGGMGNVSITWKKDDGTKAFVPVQENARISGQGTTMLSFDPILYEDEGLYRVDITDDGGDSAQAGPATLTVEAGVPVSGSLGLAILAALSALGGAAGLRRRKQ